MSKLKIYIHLCVKIIVLFNVLLIILTSCKEAYNPDPSHVIFQFKIVNQEDIDVFFSDSSIYDPEEIDLTSTIADSTYIESVFHFSASGPFEISGFRVSDKNSEEFILKYGTSRSDTIVFYSSTNYKSNPDGNKFDVEFNRSKICTDCNSNSIYKLVIDE